jgi:hypothetical protein
MDKKFSIDVQKPFLLIQKTFNSLRAENERFEPQNNANSKRESTLTGSNFLIMRALVHDVRTFYEKAILKESHHEISIEK